jgi:hypothetical protein
MRPWGFSRRWGSEILGRIQVLIDRLAHDSSSWGRICFLRPESDTTFSRSPSQGEMARLCPSTERAGFVLSCRRGRLRVSPHFYNTEAEMDRFVAVRAFRFSPEAPKSAREAARFPRILEQCCVFLAR